MKWSFLLDFAERTEEGVGVFVVDGCENKMGYACCCCREEKGRKRADC